MADIFEIAGRIHSTSHEKVAVTADEVLDGTKKQSQINTETYGHVESIDNALANLSPEQQEALGVAAKANNNEANLGFYVCDTAAGTAAKAITSANYVLTVGGSIKIKFEHANSAASGVTLKVGSAMAKPLYYDGTAVSVNNTWEDNETVEVYYDGTNYYANNVAGGGGDGVFDVSEKYPTSGVEGGNTYTLAGALAVLNANLPASKKKGGMSIKFVQSSDNKYVKYRLMSDEWSTNTENWAIAEEGVYVENPEFVYVKADAEGKILWAIKTDGGIYYGAGCPQQIIDYINERIAELSLDEYENIVTFLSDYLGGDTTLKEMIDAINAQIANKLDAEGLDSEALSTIEVAENPENIQLEIDSENKILSGRKADGTKFENLPIELQGVKHEVIYSSDWIDVKTDNEGKIIEGVNEKGEKHISKFDTETENMIKDFAPSSNTINIPLFDSNFVSPVPVTIIGTKGDENTKYELELPLEDAYNIRFKFLIKENLINQNKSCTIASINGAEIIANVVPITACQTPYTYNGEEKICHWPTTAGGIAFNKDTIDRLREKRNIGQQAFSVLYLGTNEATIENNGSAIVLTINNVVSTYSFIDYPTVNDLYKAMSQNSDIQLQFCAMDKRTCNELMKFPQIPLRATFLCKDDGGYGGSGDLDEIVDNAPFYLNYAIEDRWHQAEIVKIGNTIYCTCDGNIITIPSPLKGDNVLTLGGECGVVFKDLVVYTDSSYDAEIVNDFIISSVNPYIAIFEAHGLTDKATFEVVDDPTSKDNPMMALTVDTLDLIFSKLEKLGYVAVSVEDIASYYADGKVLPKRCYTIIFDDVRFENCMNLNFRKIFNKYGCKPALALITDRNEIITHNGVEITKKEAAAICRSVGWDIVTHTATHRSTYRLKPSQYIEYLSNDVYSADNVYGDGSIFVYPGGVSDVYIYDVMQYLGFKCSIGTPGSILRNNTLRNRYFLTRIDISSVINSSGEPYSYNYLTSRIY